MLTRKELGLILGIIIIKDKTKGCWFIKGRDWSNYATLKGKALHRTVYEMYVGPLISGREICHKCDRKGCFCPGHLFQGTHSDNMKDARHKGHGWGSHANRNRIR